MTTSLINNGTQLIAVFSDVTKMKDMEKDGQRLRSQFFSSVAHELRTPLNSIMPILKLVLQILSTISSSQQSQGAPLVLTVEQHSRIQKLVQISHNSAKHLESVIEDALDISRL